MDSIIALILTFVNILTSVKHVHTTGSAQVTQRHTNTYKSEYMSYMRCPRSMSADRC